MEEKLNLDSWDGFLGSNFLNAEDVDSEDQFFTCVDTELDTENSRPILILENSGKKHKFSLNVTNAKMLSQVVKTPQEARGKKLTFRKVFVRSPKTKEEVESLRIKTVE